MSPPRQSNFNRGLLPGTHRLPFQHTFLSGKPGRLHAPHLCCSDGSGRVHPPALCFRQGALPACVVLAACLPDCLLMCVWGWLWCRALPIRLFRLPCLLAPPVSPARIQCLPCLICLRPSRQLTSLCPRRFRSQRVLSSRGIVFNSCLTMPRRRPGYWFCFVRARDTHCVLNLSDPRLRSRLWPADAPPLLSPMS